MKEFLSHIQRQSTVLDVLLVKLKTIVFLITVIPFVIFPQKADFFFHFQYGEHDNGQQFEQLIFIDVTLFFIEFFFMEEEKIPKQKPDTFFNRQLSVVKKPEGT